MILKYTNNQHTHLTSSVPTVLKTVFTQNDPEDADPEDADHEKDTNVLQHP